jgi:D-alanyl-D-alanine carboxypeptidase
MFRKKYFGKVVLFLAAACLSLGGFAAVSHAEEDILTFSKETDFPVKKEYLPKSSIVIDGNTGQVLWSDQPDLQWSPASIAKVMTLYLAFEAMEQGKFTLDTTITANEKYQSISQIYALSNNNITAGVEYPMRELFSMMVVPSSNVATLMVANLVSDNDEAAFIKKMNDKAAELGMTNTTYYNCSGAQVSAFDGYYAPKDIDPNGDNKSTARDLAILTYHLIKNYPEVLTFTREPVVTTMKNTPHAETFETYNYSLPGAKYGYDGVDGLKTGSSPSGGFNYIATAKKGKQRLIEVVLGVGDWSDQEGEYERHVAGNAILDHVFSTYEYKKLLPKGKHTVNEETIDLEKDFYGLVKKSSTPDFKLNDGQLTLASEYGQVSEKIAAPSVAYQITKKLPLTRKPQEKPKKKIKSQKKDSHYLLSLLLTVLGVVALILSQTLKRPVIEVRRRSVSKRRGTALTRVLTVLGFGLFLAALGILLFL